ncbi:hypothetical protein [Salinigranum salinum]|uniref:hypothetical protein n=1 Tax=Salinigranum salinum TaxID=1364937 RepID=UPI0018647F9A|nr:hypothetical protein [Salinigranum salinum]
MLSLLAVFLIVLGPEAMSSIVDALIGITLGYIDYGYVFGGEGSGAPEMLLSIFERLYVYVYSFVGTMAFFFIRLFKETDMDRTALFKVSLRVPAALLLVTVFYLLVAMSTGPNGNVGQVHWLVAFLVGFYLTYSVDTLDRTTVQIFRKLFETPDREPGRSRTGENQSDVAVDVDAEADADAGISPRQTGSE